MENISVFNANLYSLIYYFFGCKLIAITKHILFHAQFCFTTHDLFYGHYKICLVALLNSAAVATGFLLVRAVAAMKKPSISVHMLSAFWFCFPGGGGPKFYYKMN